MIYTKTGEYAIKVILFLAQHSKEDFVRTSDIGKKEDIPAHYLAKILQRMVKYGYVDSFKGRRGGFKITERAKKSSILEIVERVEGPVINLKCVTGLRECTDEEPCPLHDEWADLRNKIYSMIASKSVQEVAHKYSITYASNLAPILDPRYSNLVHDDENDYELDNELDDKSPVINAKSGNSYSDLIKNNISANITASETIDFLMTEDNIISGIKSITSNIDSLILSRKKFNIFLENFLK